MPDNYGHKLTAKEEAEVTAMIADWDARPIMSDPDDDWGDIYEDDDCDFMDRYGNIVCCPECDQEMCNCEVTILRW